ncbi:hypothetical protein [Sphingomonas solaris]|uniref:Uncharacterized protein n=1 Tax=Alterirhizorhabdus solaris TaxID=2529389 RepID=A0A558R3V2_9SPHN|nr:hypothetical protein [Sphingomonas solaris]TVV74051.1 hypothetical protein FOY91_10870 [Sphingomonas solaris]
MADRKLEKVSIVPDEDRHGFRLAVSWMTGGNGREAEMLPDLFPTEAEAAESARATYGVDPVPGASPIDRHP